MNCHLQTAPQDLSLHPGQVGLKLLHAHTACIVAKVLLPSGIAMGGHHVIFDHCVHKTSLAFAC